jgi:hypothetical protein
MSIKNLLSASSLTLLTATTTLLRKTEIKLIHLNTFRQKDIRLMIKIYDPNFSIYVLTKPKLIQIDRAHSASHNR